MHQGYKKINKYAIHVIALLMTIQPGFSYLYAMDSTTIIPPYDTILRPGFVGDRLFQTAIMPEGGLQSHGFNSGGNRVNILQIWNCEQDALSMLQGFPDDSAIGKKLIQIDADDDGVRGHLVPHGELKLDGAVSFSARYSFLTNWSIGLYLPVYAMRLHNVRWIDQTQNINDQDMRVKEFLTDNFVANVASLAGLDLGGWRRIGPGDLACFVEWFHDFPQNKKLLKNVHINWRLGLVLPTGLRNDENKLFAMPFGFDGAVALPFGLGIDVTWGSCFRLGVDVQLTHIFGNTRCRRIKIAEGQTDLLFLAKANVYKDFGMIQRFNLYAELFRIWYGCCFKIGYQYYKQGDSDVSVIGNGFSSNIPNTAVNLENWTMHNVIPKFTYDFGYHFDEDARVKPELGIFAIIPVNGKRSALITTIGATFSIDF